MRLYNLFVFVFWEVDRILDLKVWVYRELGKEIFFVLNCNKTFSGSQILWLPFLTPKGCNSPVEKYWWSIYWIYFVVLQFRPNFKHTNLKIFDLRGKNMNFLFFPHHPLKFLNLCYNSQTYCRSCSPHIPLSEEILYNGNEDRSMLLKLEPDTGT